MTLINNIIKSVWKDFKQINVVKNLKRTNRVRLYCTEVKTVPNLRNLSKAEKKTKDKTWSSGAIEPSGYVLLVIPVAAFGLGTWQVQRKAWKENIIKELKDRTNLPPVDFPEDLNELESMEYHRVRVRGTFDHSKEIYMGPRSFISNKKDYSNPQGLMSTNSSGFLVVTPFHLSDSDTTILVNRGWVPKKNKSPKSRQEGQITNEIEMVGIVRHSEKRQPLGMKNMPEQGFWMYLDLEKMSSMTGAVPVLIDAVEETTVPGGPIGGQTMITLRNEHLSYIFTWYSLSAFTGYMWYRRYVMKFPV